MQLDFYLRAADNAIGRARTAGEAHSLWAGVDACTIIDPDISVLEHQAFLAYVWEKVEERFGK